MKARNFFFKFLLRNAFPLSSSSTIILLEQESGPSPLLGWKRGRLEETRVGGKKLETKSSLSRSSDHGSHQFLPFANHPGFLLRLSEKNGKRFVCAAVALQRILCQFLRGCTSDSSQVSPCKRSLLGLGLSQKNRSTRE